jgi:hypothetical protein
MHESPSTKNVPSSLRLFRSRKDGIGICVPLARVGGSQGRPSGSWPHSRVWWRKTSASHRSPGGDARAPKKGRPRNRSPTRSGFASSHEAGRQYRASRQGKQSGPTGLPVLHVDGEGHCAGPPSGALHGATHMPDIPEFSACTVKTVPPIVGEADCSVSQIHPLGQGAPPMTHAEVQYPLPVLGGVRQLQAPVVLSLLVQA